MTFTSRRGFLSAASAACLAIPTAWAAERVLRTAKAGGDPSELPQSWLDVRRLGAVGDGRAIDSNAVNRAIDAVAARGGGVVHFPAGTYACYTIRLKSGVALHLDPGATILAASVPREGLARGGFCFREPHGGSGGGYPAGVMIRPSRRATGSGIRTTVTTTGATA